MKHRHVTHPFLVWLPALNDPHHCDFFFHFQLVSVSVSVFTLSCISVERFYAICRPLSFKSTPRRAKVMIIVTWTAACLVALPDLISLDINPVLPPDFTLLSLCKPTLSQTATLIVLCFQLLFVYILPLALMFVTYLQIVRCLWSTNIPTETSESIIDAYDIKQLQY